MPDSNDLTYSIQTSPFGEAVWIHASDGSTVGRMGRMGVDIHYSAQEQLVTGVECRICTHGKPTKEDWEMFRSNALELWGIDVPFTAFSARFYS